MSGIPDPLRESPWGDRLQAAIAAVRSAGAALLDLRGSIQGHEMGGGQLKTSTDLAAEGWVLGLLQGTFDRDRFLAEETFDRAGVPWEGARTYWTVDALDGTRSYVEGFATFCVQVAYVEEGIPSVGVIGEPVTGRLYVATRGAGAWRLDSHGAARLSGSRATALGDGLRFVDSTPPIGQVGQLVRRSKGRFVECGSVGLKICRVVEDAADIYAKRFTYKLWDVAPGEVLLREVGGALGTWAGEPIDYTGMRTHFQDVLAAPRALYDELLGSGAFSE